MKIEAGRYYRTRRGTVAGPMKATNPKTYWVWVCNGTTWTANGRYYGDNEESAADLISEVYVSDTPPAPQEGKNVPSKELRDIPTKSLERFERLVSTMVSAEYANGYREACKHIIHDTPPADAPAPEAKTLRDEFASDWMKGVLANPNQPDGDRESFACMAYRMADAMMEARKK